MTFYGTMINPFGGHQNHCLFLCAKLSQLTASPGCVGNRKAKPHLDLASTLCAQSHPRLFGLTRVTTIDLGAEINSFKPTPGEYSRCTVVRYGTSRFSIWTWSPKSWKRSFLRSSHGCEHAFRSYRFLPIPFAWTTEQTSRGRGQVYPVISFQCAERIMPQDWWRGFG